MLSEDLRGLAACASAAVGQPNQTVDGLRKFVAALAVNIGAAADRVEAMERCYEAAIDDAARSAPNVVPSRRAGRER